MFEEGDLYRGHISLSGSEGPERCWIVVSPFGKKHLHSVDAPLELHCWPISSAEQGIHTGRLRYAGRDPEHPAVVLQRVKEGHGIRDVHLALDEHTLGQLFGLLESAVEEGEKYAPYLAGEIIAFGERSDYSSGERDALRERVIRLLGHEPGPVDTCR